MCNRLGIVMASLLLSGVGSPVASAHFIWLVQEAEEGGLPQMHIYFSELAEPGDSDLLKRLEGVQVIQVTPDGKTHILEVERETDRLVARRELQPDGGLFVLHHDYGVIERGGEKLALRYYAKTGPVLGDSAWQKVDCSKWLTLDVTPAPVGQDLELLVRWEGNPVSGSQVKVTGPGDTQLEATSDEQGKVRLTLNHPGLYSIRARHMVAGKQAAAGKQDGTGTPDVGANASVPERHYCTLALRVPREHTVPLAASSSNSSSRTSNSASAAQRFFPPLPETVTSFGAAIIDDMLYVYGGHTGRAHDYYYDAQAKTLRRLNLQDPQAWESLGEGPPLQGLAMVAHDGKLYRIGGFTAKNAEGDEHELWSHADVACYDPQKRSWEAMSPLPEPRSSFDAAVLGDRIYVVGGWQLQGQGDGQWHTTAYVMDLTAAEPTWTALPAPPFRRRALSLAAHQNKLYAIGGMQSEGGPTTRVDVFDPATGEWSQGSSLVGEGMDGFGNSSFALDGRLYVSTLRGDLQRLSEDGSSWEEVQQLERARFFHRMLPWGSARLVFVGGADMSVGKFADVEVLTVK